MGRLPSFNVKHFDLSFADALAHVVIPAHPVLKPHARMIHHFRFIVPLLDDPVVLRVYDSAIQLARNSDGEPTEEEFEVGWEAAEDIKRTSVDCFFVALVLISV